MTGDETHGGETPRSGGPAPRAPGSSPAGPPPTDRSAAPPPAGVAPSLTPPVDPDAAGAVAAERRPRSFEGLTQQAARAALVAGLLGVLAGPWLARSDPGLYLALVVDVVALGAGALGLWGALRHTARLDYAVAGLIMGAAGLYFWVSYVTGPPPGST